jgi:hypothetical protein
MVPRGRPSRSLTTGEKDICLGTIGNYIQMPVSFGCLFIMTYRRKALTAIGMKLSEQTRKDMRKEMDPENHKQILWPRFQARIAPPVFLSYGRGDSTELARNLKQAFEAEGIRCWLDEEAIPAGSHWVNVIGDAIDESEVLVAVVNAKYASSSFCQDEVCVCVCVCVRACVRARGYACVCVHIILTLNSRLAVFGEVERERDGSATYSRVQLQPITERPSVCIGIYKLREARCCCCRWW